MICPHCQKIIAEGGQSCPFCGMQFSAPPQGQAQAGAGVPQGQYAPQQAYAPSPPTLLWANTFFFSGGFAVKVWL